MSGLEVVLAFLAVLVVVMVAAAAVGWFVGRWRGWRPW